METNDISVPAALIFIDSLGSTLPFKSSFTFKELTTFCHREGIATLAERELVEDDLLKIAHIVTGVTNGGIHITAGPTDSGSRMPLSKIDLRVAGKELLSPPQKKTATEESLTTPSPVVPSGPLTMFANVILKNGIDVHVVELRGKTIIGVDNHFAAHEFEEQDIARYANLDDPLA